MGSKDLRRSALGPGAFRLVLAMAVFLSHISRFEVGRPAVMVFFMLSGFWVAKMQDGAHHQKIIAFVVGRLLRVWPALAATAIVASCALWGLHAPLRGTPLSTLTLLGLASRGNDIIGVVWSLDIEMQFYLLLPLALAAKRWLEQPLILLAVSIGSFAIGAALSVLAGLTTVLIYAPMFAFGLWTYMRGWAPSGRLVAPTAAVAIIALIAINLEWRVFGHLSGLRLDTLFMAACALLAPFVAWNVRQRSGRFDRLLGNLSYPLYLVHYPSIRISALVFGASFVAKVAAFGLSAAWTAALYVVVERPVEAMRKALRQNGKLDVAAEGLAPGVT